MGWTWYLANDMQFFWISPLLLYPLHRYARVGVAILVVVFAASIATPLAISYVNHLSASAVYGLPAHALVQRSRASAGDVMSLVWTKPWCRITPYLLGIAAGYIYRRFSGPHGFLERMGRRTMTLGWIVSGCLVRYRGRGERLVRDNIAGGMYHETLMRDLRSRERK